jgi:UDP-N-acetylmuramoyl-L-alanyl-D-glutamate--2,6-diaminopimelate ligase
MENYFEAKALLFTADYAKAAVICVDDDWGMKLASTTSVPTLTIGREGNWKTSEAASTATGVTTQTIEIADTDSISLSVNMLGSYNAMNAACALAACQLLGMSIASSLESLKKVRPIPGRLEQVSIASPGTAIVDYAHTPDAVATVLTVIKDANPNRIITVIGCGGDRDSAKRPLMGKVAAQLSNIVIVTDDNPRSEDPAAIRSAMIAGTKGCRAEILEVADRRAAIAKALSLASSDDVIAVLGKGHESGQEVAGELIPFDDRDVVRQESENV